MEQETSRNLRLGAFVAAGTLFLIVAFYFIGNKQNLFGSTFRVNARFYNVNGLMAGNNVRFAGIDIGTVETLEIVNDTTVLVTMVLEKKIQSYIRQNAVAAVGTDGLMGNKLININSVPVPGAPVKEGSELKTLRPLAMDEVARTLNITNTNVADISSNLSGITGRIGDKNVLWELLQDTLLAENIKISIVNLKDISVSAKHSMNHLANLSGKAVNARTSIGQLLADTLLYGKIAGIADNLEKAGDSAKHITGNLSLLISDLKQGKGTLGQAFQDTLLMYRLTSGLRSIDSGAAHFNENMIALQHTWPLKGYFKKRARKKQR
jgi:phospholipid/cholesterol/gamma-HCH transport system substrate-binding protein